MTDYTELIKSLKACEHDECYPERCDWFGKYQVDLRCKNILLANAADAIEDMAKHITEMHERVTVLQIDRGHLETEVKEWRRLNNENLLPKRGEWELIDGAEPMRWGCSRCKYLSWETSSYCPRCGAKMEVQE